MIDVDVQKEEGTEGGEYIDRSETKLKKQRMFYRNLLELSII